MSARIISTVGRAIDVIVAGRVVSHLRFAVGVCVLAAALLMGAGGAVAVADPGSNVFNGNGGTNASGQNGNQATNASGPRTRNGGTNASGENGKNGGHHASGQHGNGGTNASGQHGNGGTNASGQHGNGQAPECFRPAAFHRRE